MEVKFNKKGWIRITEAIFGIMLMFSILLIVNNEKTIQISESKQIVSLERDILDKISSNYTLRNATINGELSLISKFVNASLSDNYGYGVRICNLTDSCEFASLPPVKEVYSEERIIGSAIDKYEPKRIKLSVWKGFTDFFSVPETPRLADGEPCTSGLNCTSGFCNASGFCKSILTWYFDADCDTYGNGSFANSEYMPTIPGVGCINTSSDVSNITTDDCDDHNKFVNVGPSCSTRWYFDPDCDGYGNGTTIIQAVAPTIPGECINDSSITGVLTIDDLIDCNNTNNLVWENLTGYRDIDADGHGNVSTGSTFCTNGTLPAGYVSLSDDCDDNNAALIGVSSCISSSITANMVAYWTFDDGNLTDEESDIDSTFYNNTTVTPATFVADRRGITNNAISFNGLNEWVDTNININASDMKTISFFAKFNDLTSAQEIVSKSEMGNGVEVILYNSNLGFYVMGSAPDKYVLYDPSSLIGSWHYIVTTLDMASNMSLYVDGSLVDTAFSPVDVIEPTPIQNILLGKWTEPSTGPYGGSRFFNGSLDEVMIFNRSLTSSEVSQLYNALK